MALEDQLAASSKAILALNTRIDQLNTSLIAMLGKLGGGAAQQAKQPPAAAEPTKGKAVKDKPKRAAAESSTTIEELRTAAVAISGNKTISEGKDRVVALLQRNGAERLAELATDAYGAFMAGLERIRDEDWDPRDSDSDDAGTPDEDF